jgi:predicted DNA-binding antitoxin AbrB/MazE fold protein
VSIEARYEDGVFRPLGDAGDMVSGKVYRVFSEEEIRGLAEDLAWLKAAERSFVFWDNEEDSVYDRL